LFGFTSCEILKSKDEGLALQRYR